MRLNNKGLSIIEVVVTFTLIMFFAIGLLVIIVNYRNTVAVSLERLKLETFKNTLTQDINDHILDKGLKEINTEGECPTLLSNGSLNRCINLVFYDGDQKAFGTSKIKTVSDFGKDSYSALTDEQKEQIEKSITTKYIYYDGIKYKLKDELPEDIPEGRTATELQQITIFDGDILRETYTVLEDGTKVYIYNINVNVNHVDFNEDFGIHIVASTDQIGL